MLFFCLRELIQKHAFEQLNVYKVNVKTNLIKISNTMIYLLV